MSASVNTREGFPKAINNYSLQHHESDWLAPPSYQYVFVCFLHSTGYIVIQSVALICISLMTGMRGIFFIFTATWKSCFVKCQFQVCLSVFLPANLPFTYWLVGIPNGTEEGVIRQLSLRPNLLPFCQLSVHSLKRDFQGTGFLNFKSPFSLFFPL